MARYDTNLAAEFYTLSVLYRLGAAATLTLGNKKSVDIVVVRSAGDTLTIDVSGIARKTCWPVSNVPTDRAKHFVFSSRFSIASTTRPCLRRCMSFQRTAFPICVEKEGGVPSTYRRYVRPIRLIEIST